MRFARTRISQALAAALSVAAIPPAAGQVVRDGTLGPAGAIATTPISSTRFSAEYRIQASDGQQRGGNLFHSFSRFDIDSTLRATFFGPADVTNVISRVTGGTRSEIFGGIRSEIRGANVFLINPTGLLFGANAVLDVSGSFHASTASYLALGADGRFDASNPAATVLTSAPPSAFGFLATPAEITVRSTLSVPPGAALTLTGGDLTLTGASLTAPGGFVGLASVAGAGQVALSPSDLIPDAALPRGTIALTNVARLGASNTAGAGGGKVVIRGGVLTLQNSIVALQNDGTLPALGIVVDATGSLTLAGNSSISAESSAVGSSGAIDVRANSIALSEGSTIHSGTSAAGAAGPVTVTAADSINLTGANTSINSVSGGAGPGGEILIVTPMLTMDEGALVSANVFNAGAAGNLRIESDRVSLANGAQILAASFGAGAAGNVTIDAATSLDLSGRGHGRVSGVLTSAVASGAAGDIVVRTPALTVNNGIIAADALSSGAPGNITIETRTAAITGGGVVSANSEAPGPGGTVKITASESVTISGRDAAATPSPSVVRGTNKGDGRGADIVIATPVLALDDGGRITVATTGRGPGGSVRVDGERVVLTNGGLISANSTAEGLSGDVRITASQSIVMSATDARQRTGIFARATGTGDGGIITLSAPAVTLDGATVNAGTDGSGAAGSTAVTTARLRLGNGARIDLSTTDRGRGGNIDIVATESVTVAGRNSAGVSAIISGASGTGIAGAVNVTAPDVAIDGGSISGSATGAGAGGDIALNTSRLALSNDGQIVSAASAAGAAGNIRINATESVRISGDAATPTGSGIFATSAGRGRGGDVQVTAPTVSVAGGSIAASVRGVGDAGRIAIQARNVAVSGGGLIDSSSKGGTGAAGVVSVTATDALTVSGRGADGVASTISSATEGPGAGGDIRLSASAFTLSDAVLSANTSGRGAAGRIALDAQRVVISNGGVISSGTTAAGNGGTVNVAATESIVITGRNGPSRSRISNSSSGPGNAGAIFVSAPAVTLENDGFLRGTASERGNAGLISMSGGTLSLASGGEVSTSAEARGAGGAIDIVFSGAVALTDGSIRSTSAGPGDAGNITVQGRRVNVTRGSVINTDSTASGSAGVVRVDAIEAIDITGRRPGGNVSTISSEVAGTASGGEVILRAPVLTINQGQVSADARGNATAGQISIVAPRVALANGARISSSTLGDATGGKVNITASDEVAITDSGASLTSAGIFTTSGGGGRGGDVLVTAPRVSVAGGSIAASALGAGDAGNITVEGTRVAVTAGGVIDSSSSLTATAGRILLNATEAIEVSGDNGGRTRSAISSKATGAGLGGEIVLRAPVVTLDGGRVQADALGGGTGGQVSVDATRVLLMNGGQVSSNAANAGAGGKVSVVASESVTVTDTVADTSAAGLRATTNGRGRGGEIEVRTPTLRLEGGAIATTTFSAGDAGRVAIQAREVTVARGGLIDSSSIGGNGAAGAVSVAATDALTISGQNANGFPSTISSLTDGPGAGGDIQLSAATFTLSDAVVTANTSGRGAAGRIGLDARRVVISNGGLIASGTAAAGHGGIVNVAATESILITGRNGSSRSRITNSSSGAGNAGATFITAPSITLESDGFVRGTATASGAAGDIFVRAGMLTLAGSADVSTSATGAGRGGLIAIVATEAIGMTDSSIRSTSAGSGDAGNISVDAGRSLTLVRSAITTEANRADGGNIFLKSIDMLRLTDSRITTSVGNGFGNGGNITIDPTFVVLNGSQIIANAFGGNGGNIDITTDALLKSGDSVIEASSQLGVQGTIRISAPDSDLAGSLTPLSGGLVDPSQLLRESCSARAGRAGNSFTGVGHGGLPQSPGGLAFSSYAPTRESTAEERGPVYGLAFACAR